LSAPEAFDVNGETEATRKLYGLDEKLTEDIGRRCLLGRRLIERGVRFVQIWSGAGGPTNNWDNHASIAKELPPMCTATDKPIAGLLKDLKARGMLDETLILWSTEFGRMPFSQGSEGRDHNGGTLVGWMAGGGVRGGTPALRCARCGSWFQCAPRTEWRLTMNTACHLCSSRQMPSSLSAADARVIERREFLWRFGGGLGGIALAHLLGRHGFLADTS